MPAQCDDQFDQALARWFARHHSAWSGTASELIAAIKSRGDGGDDLWSQPARALYNHLESHREILHSMGVDVLPHTGFPRMVRLRICQEESIPGPLPSEHTIESISGPVNDPSPAGEDRRNHSVPDAGSQVVKRGFSPVVNLGNPVITEKGAHDKRTDGENYLGGAFEDTAQALFGIVEMRDRIRDEGLDLESTMRLVASRTQAITGSSGVILGWLQDGTIVYPAQIGVAAAMAGLPCQANLLRSCISQGTVLPLPDVQQDPVAGDSYRRGGVRSVIVAPIFQNRRVAGAMELLFGEMRSFSSGDVMTLELIADLVTEQVTGVEKKVAMPAPTTESRAPLRITESIEPEDCEEDRMNERRPGYSQDAIAAAPPETVAHLRPIIAVDLAAPVSASPSQKRVWTRLP